MKAPSFWYQPPGLLSALLQPLGWLYGKGGKVVSSFKNSQHFPIPIISVGNIVSGGSGKTPAAIALALILQEKGINVHFVTRGYGGNQEGPIKVNPSFHTYNEVGDEPLLLAQYGPTWVAKNRPLGVQAALENGAGLIILDDGHQTSSLYKDISFVVVDHLQGFGNGHVIPAGPLREECREGMKRADAIIAIGKDEIPFSKQMFRAKSVSQPFSPRQVIAFCGLGFPLKFYQSLKDAGVDVFATESFPDHYVYQEKDLLQLQNLAEDLKVDLVTTRKDWVKLPFSWQTRVHVLDIRIEFDNPEEIYQFIFSRLLVNEGFRKHIFENPSAIIQT